MSSIDIILLGMLIEGPMSAYEMNKILEERQVRIWLKISEAAVYRNLRHLQDRGCTENHTEKQGLMPEKTIYTITPQGREYFVELMEKASLAPVRLHFDFDAFAAHFHHLSAGKGLDLLKNLEDNFKQRKEELEQGNMTFGPDMPLSIKSLLKLRFSCLDESLTWAKSLAKEVKKDKKR